MRNTFECPYCHRIIYAYQVHSFETCAKQQEKNKTPCQLCGELDGHKSDCPVKER